MVALQQRIVFLKGSVESRAILVESREIDSRQLFSGIQLDEQLPTPENKQCLGRGQGGGGGNVHTGGSNRVSRAGCSLHASDSSGARRPGLSPCSACQCILDICVNFTLLFGHVKWWIALFLSFSGLN